MRIKIILYLIYYSLRQGVNPYLFFQIHTRYFNLEKWYFSKYEIEKDIPNKWKLESIYIEKKSEWMIIFTGLAAMVNVSSNFYLMPTYGMMGAAFAALLAYFVMMVSIYIANQKLYRINYEYGRIFWIICYLCAALALYYYLDLNLLIRFLLIIGLPVLLAFLGFFKEDEKVYIREIIARFRS